VADRDVDRNVVQPAETRLYKAEQTTACADRINTAFRFAVCRCLMGQIDKFSVNVFSNRD
jgi:hypothetical protein